MPSFANPSLGKPDSTCPTLFLLASLICMFLAEAFMIRGLWYKPVSPIIHTLRGFDLPFLVWIPASGRCRLQQVIRKQTKKGEVEPGVSRHSVHRTQHFCS